MKQNYIMSQVDATWCSFFLGGTHLQNNWIGVFMWLYFCNLRQDKTLLLQLLSSLFLGGILVAKACICRHLRGKILTTSTFTLLFFLCHLLLQMAPDSGSPKCIYYINIVSIDNKSLIWIMDPYHSHLQPQKLDEAGGTGRLPDTGGSSR